MANDYRQIEWDAQLADDCRQLVRLAVREDLDRFYDWTSVLLVPDGTPGEAVVVAREPGVLAGLPAVRIVLEEYDRRLRFEPLASEGQAVDRGDLVACIAGPARGLLAAERPLLNLLGRLSGIATLTRQYVAAIGASRARIYDTRKTTPGYRRLEKYAVRLGGGRNHRAGLYDGILIKDNHLAIGARSGGGPDASGQGFTPAEAVARLRSSFAELPESDPRRGLVLEVEVDTLEQLAEVLPAGPDVVLLDNMRPETLREAVAMRDAAAPQVELEASGGVNLATIAIIAATGVERISVGSLTHAAKWLDFGLDWR